MRHRERVRRGVGLGFRRSWSSSGGGAAAEPDFVVQRVPKKSAEVPVVSAQFGSGEGQFAVELVVADALVWRSAAKMRVAEEQE